MKPLHKSIIATIGSIVAATSIVATATCVPGYTRQVGYNLKTFSFKIPELGSSVSNPYLNYNLLGSVNVGFKTAALGTNQINDGNYIIYIGSQAYNSNNTFLYGNAYTATYQFQSEQTMQLDGLFGSALANFNTLKIKPQVLMFQDLITPQTFTNKAQFEINVNNWKHDPIFGNTKADQEAKMKYWGTTNSKEIDEKRYFATGNPVWSMDPFATYSNWEGKTVYYRTDQSAITFRNVIIPFMKKHFSNLQNIDTSQGIIIGYKNGKICSEYSGSFNSSSSSSSSSSNNTSNQSNQFVSLYQNKKSPSVLAQNNPASNNQFLEWLQYNYGTNKSES